MRKFLLKTLAIVLSFVCGSAAYAQNHNFVGSYKISGFYMDYVTEEYSMDDLPLEIGEDNVINNFANYTPFNTIKGEVEGNQFTFTCEDENFILDIDWDTFHYIVLNGETFGDEYEKAPIYINYDPETEFYDMSSWMLWDYDPFSGEYTKLGYCMVFGIEPGKILEKVDYSGSYLVKGTKTVYTDGEATETEYEFIMTLRPDESQEGFYEFTEFAGYEVGLVPRGWLGVYGAVYGSDIELQGTDIELNEAGDGIKLAAPFMDYDDMYTVTVFFEDEDSGTVSDFSVWKMVDGEPVELLAKWSYLTFGKTNDDPSGIKLPAVETGNADETPVYYDLRGFKVENPSGGIYILKQGSKTSKVIIRN